MLSIWLFLAGSFIGRNILSDRVARVCYALLLAPHLVSPFVAMNGTLTSEYRVISTRLMQFGIFPIVLFILLRCLWALWKCRRENPWLKFFDGRLIGFLASAALTITGFVLGAMIRGSNTMIPAHYHAAIGAVTVGYMAISYRLLAPAGFSVPSDLFSRLIPWQIACFGFGQVIFAIGFAWGGMHGLGRKAYAAEQHIRTAGEILGLSVMGLGGLIAVTGGLLYLFLMFWAGTRRPAEKMIVGMNLQPRSVT
jgi:hypothetical protein